MARSLSQLFYALGGSVSPGKSNDELIDHLIDAEFIRTPAIQRVFRSVDRGNYYHPNQRHNAYKDIAWRMGNLHLSAPCVYSVVMETLKLKPGLSFLNIGSGSGYLSTMAGLLLGPYGINHGIEYHKDIVDYAYDRLDEFLKSSKVVDERDFCEPVFTWGNCLTLDSNVQQYDRVYCGAACPEEYEGYIKNLVKINGILIMPLNDKLLKITRVNETVWTAVKVLSVSFAPLILPPPAKKGEVLECAKLGDFKPPTLLQLCRYKLREYLRENIEAEHEELIDIRKSLPPQRSSMKLFIVNCGDDDDGEESESDGEDLDSFSLLMRSLHRTSFLLRSFSQVDNLSSSDQNEESELENEEDTLKFASLTTVRDATEDADRREETGPVAEIKRRSLEITRQQTREKIRVDTTQAKFNILSELLSEPGPSSSKVEKKTKNNCAAVDSSSKVEKKTKNDSKTANRSSKCSKVKKNQSKSRGKSKSVPKASTSSADPMSDESSEDLEDAKNYVHQPRSKFSKGKKNQPKSEGKSKRVPKASNASPNVDPMPDIGDNPMKGFATFDKLEDWIENPLFDSSTNQPKSGRDPMSDSSVTDPEDFDNFLRGSFAQRHSFDINLPPSHSTRSKTNNLKRKHSSLDDGPSTSAGCSSRPSKKTRKKPTRKQAAKKQPAKETFSRTVKLDSNNKVAEDLSHSYFLTQKIAALPLPTFLRQYMNYKRENF